MDESASAPARFVSMRHTTTLLIFFASFAVVQAQYATPPPAQEPTPAPAAAAEPAPAEEPAGFQPQSFELAPESGPAPGPQAPAEGDFLNLPGQPANATTEIVEEETVVVEETIEADSDFVDPNQLVPDAEAEAAPDPRTLAAAGGEQERKLKVRYKEVRTKAEQDPEIAALRETAEKSPTFEGERAAYRAYYRALFKKIRKTDPSLAKKCDLMEKAYLDRLAQTRVEPTIPLEPPPKPELLAN